MTHLDLFSGIGGFALAARWAGIETVQFVEIDPFCQKVLAKNFPGVPIHDDIKTFMPTNRGLFVLTGGPPCQATSVAAAIQGRRTGATLWPEMARIIGLVKPKWIVVEQPAGNKRWEIAVTVSLEGFGYAVARSERQASDYNAPHKRRRVFIVANASSERCNKVARIGGTLQAYEKPWPAPPRGTWSQARTGNCRVDDGVPNRVDRLRSLGNAIVPQVAYEIVKGILKVEG